MATSAAGRYPQPPSSPPPVYLRSSPPIPPVHRELPQRTSLNRPPSMSVSRKPLPSSTSTPHGRSESQEYSVPQVRNHEETDQAVDLQDDYALSLSIDTLSDLSLSDQPHKEGKGVDGSSENRSDRNGSQAEARVSRHTPTSSASWSVVDPRVKDGSLPNTSTSSLDQGDPKDSQTGSSRGSLDSTAQTSDLCEPLHYHHRPYETTAAPLQSPSATKSGENLPRSNSRPAGKHRTHSVYSLASETAEGRNRLSPHPLARASSRDSSASPDVRPVSFIDQLNSVYPQAGPAPVQFGNSHLQSSIGNNASLLSHKQTFDMYLANVKKTDDSAIQYEFAIFMINAMLEMPPDGSDATSSVYGPKATEITRASLLRESKLILQRLADRSYPFAQYYLADGYASGLFGNGKEDYDRAFTLFVAASKHGHVEACYRTALCYEFGWGTKVEATRAQQFYRQAASKNHPGAMLRMAKACLEGDMGLGKRYREGIKWMKRATDSADAQYNSGPYELGLLHETGYGDDIFLDPSYAAQLFTKSADLGHAEASYRLGDAYEHGKLNCPRDPALSIHFYTTAAQGGHPLAMMALCAWYLIGAEPILEKDEAEAYEWAKRAADTGLSKAQYAVGYFTETGIGCRRDILQANVWYVKAADQGDMRAKHRLATIQAAADGVRQGQVPTTGSDSRKNKANKKSEGKKRFGIF
ncbi:chitin synthase activator [Aspergillus heteromorphus CBS 117.55]|uniref:Chitin synthase activator n=1 Tax=Aspergillus heteromorphus CBS 117.55 TaxID=1448321 RepID=A0A317WTU8_9EURO|nr:chitin synthase activator [Aspergillus heteromorphus CBS 117.55]PWY89241.1 chitin synthase activator [Aspergillus heteromorphus CBS 117.55]